MAFSLLVLVGHACEPPAPAYAERGAAGLQSDPQPADERHATVHAPSCEATGTQPACLALGQPAAVAGAAVSSSAPGATALGTDRPLFFARPPYFLLHAPLRI